MNWKRAIEEERAMLMRIVALILALADVAERASNRSSAVCGLVCWILRQAEAVLSAYADLPAAMPVPFAHRDGVGDEARRLALRFRTLACILIQEARLSLLDEPGSRAKPFPHGRMSFIARARKALGFVRSVAVLDTS